MFSAVLAHSAHLDLIFHSSCKVLNDEGRFHDWCRDKVFVPLVLLLEFS